MISTTRIAHTAKPTSGPKSARLRSRCLVSSRASRALSAGIDHDPHHSRRSPRRELLYHSTARHYTALKSAGRTTWRLGAPMGGASWSTFSLVPCRPCLRLYRLYRLHSTIWTTLGALATACPGHDAPARRRHALRRRSRASSCWRSTANGPAHCLPSLRNA